MAKKKKGRLPKEVLGVKVPKELRKAGEKLIEQVQGPAGKQAIAGALTAVVGAVATAALTREAAKRAETPVPPQGDAPPRNEAGEAFARAAEALVGKIFAPRA